MRCQFHQVTYDCHSRTLVLLSFAAIHQAFSKRITMRMQWTCYFQTGTDIVATWLHRAGDWHHGSSNHWKSWLRIPQWTMASIIPELIINQLGSYMLRLPSYPIWYRYDQSLIKLCPNYSIDNVSVYILDYPMVNKHRPWKWPIF